MNTMMVLGFGIMAVGAIIVLILLIKWSWIEKDFGIKRRLLLLLVLAVFVVGGGFFAQAGEKQARSQFSESESALMESGKSYADFSAEEQKVYMIIKFKFLASDAEKMSAYHDRILNWAIDEYLSNNEHRTDLTRSDVEGYILNDWALRRGN